MFGESILGLVYSLEAQYVLSVETRGVLHTRGSYYSKKLHDMANEQVCILNVLVLSVNVCNLSMHLIGGTNV